MGICFSYVYLQGWTGGENEKNKEYIWIWDEETVEKYEMMTKFVRKYLRTNGTK